MISNMRQAVIISPHFVWADNDCLKLLIIDGGLLIKYNARNIHVITIIIIWLGIHLIINQAGSYKTLTPSKSVLIAKWTHSKIITIKTTKT